MTTVWSYIKKKIPVKYKEFLKQCLRGENNSYNKLHNDIAKKAVSIEKDFERTLSIKLETTIAKETAFPVISKAKDEIIERKLRSKKYTFQNMLALLDPYELSPLSALVLFYTKDPCRVRFKVEGDALQNKISGTIEEWTNYHRVPIFGLYPNRRNGVKIELLNEDEMVIDHKKIYITTQKLPKLMEGAVNVKKYSGDSAFPLIMVSGKSTPYPFAFDSFGIVRYYLNYRPRGYGLFPLANGRFILIERTVLIPTYEIPHSTQIYEMDFLGRVHREYHVKTGCHHDVYEMTPGGNLILVSNSLKDHQEDMVLELDRQTGEIVKTLDMREIFGDLYRNSVNWVHVNTVSYDPKDNTVLICPRNLHSAIKVDWGTNELLWIIGDPRFWEGTSFMDKVLRPIGEIQWFYQPHAVYELDVDLDGNVDTKHVILFDNHWHKRRKVKFFDKDPKSYTKIFTVNTKEKTVKLEHRYGGVKSKITSNSLLDYDKRRVFSMGAYLDPLVENRGGMIYEFDYDTEELLNQYSIQYYFYRAYEFKPNYQELAKPMQLSSSYIVGTLQEPEMTDQAIPIPNKDISQAPMTTDERLTIKIIEETLYIGTKDHLIKQVHFIGKKYQFLHDLSEREQTKPELFGDMIYYIAIPLKALKEDTYHLVVNFKGELYDAKERITVK